jgi:endonuclease G
MFRGPGVTKDVPPLGLFRTFQAPIRDIAELTGLGLGQLIAVDRMPIAAILGAARAGIHLAAAGRSSTSHSRHRQVVFRG